MPVNPASSVRGPSGVFVRARQCRGRHEGRGRVRAEPPAHGTASRAACLPSRAAAPSHNLETYLHAYLDGGGTAADPKGPLFRTIGRTTGQLTRTPLPQANAHAMIRRRPAGAGIKTQVGNHTFRATGITAYLKNGGTRENGAAMANHASTRTTQLYDGGRDEGSLDEVERISI
jgi:integrase